MEKRMVIMGATSGIGRKVAELYIGRGWRVGVAGRRVHLLEELKRINPDRVEYEPIDITGTCPEKKLYSLIGRLGGMDIYLHCSGIGRQNFGLDIATELATVQTNCTGFARMAGAAFRYFAEKGTGHIAAVTSIAGTKGLGVAPAYSATKRFQNIYIQSLAQLARMKHYDICFTDIRPGFVDTDLLSGNQHYPFMMKPEKVACAIARAINYRRRKVVINRKYALLTFLWSMIPDYIWERLDIHTKAKNPDKL